jgi:hypothetical protein
MASTYTPKLNLAKPAHGDVDWHIPINENWDKLDTKVDNAAKTALVSKITVDADKNWNGKNITNVGYIAATRIRPEASDEVRWTKTGTGDSRQDEITHTVTIPAVYTPGTAKIIVDVNFYWSGEHGMGGYVRVRVNGVQVYSNSGNGTHEATISIKGGDLVSITARSLVSMSIALSDTTPVVYPGAPTWPS